MFLWDWFAGILNYLGKNSIESKKKINTSQCKILLRLKWFIKGRKILVFLFYFVKVLCF